jgi:hypothetical protein
MDSLLQAKLSAIRDAMTESPRPVTLTPPIQGVVLAFLRALDTSTLAASGGSETQQSSSTSEKAVIAMLNVPMIEKSKQKLKSLTCLPALHGDYFGFKRAVEHRNECRFAMPTTDGVYAIHQPYGSQANPDILLLDIRDRTVVCQFGIEIKSGGPTWNTHIQTADRNMLYIAIKDHVHYFFGDHIRSKESLVLALAWDELQREIADALNQLAQSKGLKNMCVAYPKQEFRGLNLDEGRDARHAEIKAWLTASTLPASG